MTTTRSASSAIEPQIVRDEDDRGVRVLLGGLDHLDDLRLDGDVERRRGLVGDEDVGSFAIAIAIMTRWRIPPENSCGY